MKVKFLRDNPKPFLPHILRWWFFVVTFVLISTGGWLSHFWIFRYPNLITDDTLFRWNLLPRRVADHTAIVTIKEDLRDFGDATLSPAAKLEAAVCAVLAHQPKVLVVDFDTGHPSYQQMQLNLWTNIVWARAFYREQNRDVVRPVLGRQTPPDGVAWGFAVAIEDPDGVIRHFPLSVKTDGKRFPTVLAKAIELSGVPTGSAMLEVPTLGSGFQQDSLELAALSATEYLPLPAPKQTNGTPPASTRLEKCRQGLPAAQFRAGPVEPDYSNKIVLLIGQYLYEDRHQASYGQDVWGGELFASGMESALRADGPRKLSDWVKWPVKVAVAVLLAALFHFVRPSWALAAVMLVLLPVVAVANVLAVVLGGFLGETVPMVLGVVLEQLSNLVERAEHGEQ